MNNPYYYGWTPEVTIGADGTPNYTKHYSMGRFAHELAYVMPDKKTVYLSDDGTNVGLFMFVADTAEDLSAGTLYAAKWVQTRATVRAWGRLLSSGLIWATRRMRISKQSLQPSRLSQIFSPPKRHKQMVPAQLLDLSTSIPKLATNVCNCRTQWRYGCGCRG